jgi:uncharacterized membrane protein YccC
MANVNPPLIGVGEHPHAAFWIRRCKALSALAGFLIAAWAGNRHGLPFDAIATRGVVGAVAGYLIGGFAAVTFWRHMLQAEARSAVQRALELRRRELERLSERHRSDQ